MNERKYTRAAIETTLVRVIGAVIYVFFCFLKKNSISYYTSRIIVYLLTICKSFPACAASLERSLDLLLVVDLLMSFLLVRRDFELFRYLH